MLIAVLAAATALAAVWLVLLGKVSQDDWIVAAYNKVLDNLAMIEKWQLKDEEKRAKLAGYHGVAAAVMRLFSGGTSEKEIRKLQKRNELLQGGRFKGVGIFSMPGYVIQRTFQTIGRSGFHKTVMIKCTELYGRKHAERRARQLLAKILSYPLIGISLSLMAGALFLGMGSAMFGLVLLGVGPLMVLTLCYSLYDGLNKKAVLRREVISRQFPNVVSKLALLVTSGMIMERAWKETALSQSSELYKEMRKTSEEIDNLISPEAAYGSFINRCNTKETAKLASAITQNLSRGNAEIGRLLKELAREAWAERRHAAKRNAEKANSKLIIPTMLLFVAILIMIMVPVAINFTGNF